MLKVPWTEERNELLTKLWAAGHSASQIALKLGGFEHTKDGGRNSVIGRVHRMNLPGRLTTVNGPRSKKVKRQRPAGASSRGRSRVGWVSSTDIAHRKAMREKPRWDEPKPAPPPMRPLMVTLMELTPSMCRWPFGDPDQPGFGFCGNRRYELTSYCEHHRQLSCREFRR